MRTQLGRLLIVGSLITLAASMSAARAQELDPAFRADIVKLMEMTGAGQLGEQIATLVSGQVLEGFKKAHPDVPKRAFELAKKVLDSEFATAFQGPDGIMTRMAPIYSKYFTHDEVRGMIAFYGTDLGRKTIAVMPALIQEGARVGQEWAAGVMPRVQTALQERLKAEGFIK